MRLIILPVGMLLCLAACTSPDRQIRHLEQDMLAEFPLLLADEILPVVFTEQRMDSIASACAVFRSRVERIGQRKLNPEQTAAIEHAHRQLAEYESFYKELSTNPDTYNLGGYLKNTLVQASMPMPRRLPMLTAQMERADLYYAAARNNLNRPEPERARIAVRKHLHALELLDGELRDSLAGAKLDPYERETFEEALLKAKLAIKDYIAFCRSIVFEHRDSTLILRAPMEQAGGFE